MNLLQSHNHLPKSGRLHANLLCWLFFTFKTGFGMSFISVLNFYNGKISAYLLKSSSIKSYDSQNGLFQSHTQKPLISVKALLKHRTFSCMCTV